MHMKPYYVIKRDDEDDEDDDVEVHHHHHYHHGAHPDHMGHMGASHAGDLRTHEHHAAISDVLACMEDHPHTWRQYLDKPGGMISIIEMEYLELMEAKAGGSRSNIEMELKELAAACILALKKMKK